MKAKSGYFLLIVALVCLLSQACSTAQKPGFDALSQGMTRYIFTGEKHKLFVLANWSGANTDSGSQAPEIHIYLEGDGRSWIHRYEVSKDPTPAYPLALHLMRLDPTPSVYITRPCYHNIGGEECDPDIWTSGRYSEDVVEVMAAAIDDVLSKQSLKPRVTLIGYSGGATLALLLAGELDSVVQVVSVAGNLDIDAWTAWHDYLPLTNSVNPAKLQLPQNVDYLHLAGQEDEVIPPRLGKSVYSRSGHRLRRFEGVDHRCCWVDLWPEILREHLVSNTGGK